MKNFLIPLITVLCFKISHSQELTFNPYEPPVSYRGASNPYYWKNRKPFEGYWQQDVYYNIHANLNEHTHIISGEETLTYWNNSPDTLSFVFFHLYQQAFVRGGHLENLNLANHVKQTFGKYESNGLGEVIESMKSENEELRREQDLSVVKVYLTHALMPQDSITFHIKFKTYFDNGSQRRRMKKFNSPNYTHYDGVHWYPRICAYDRKLGWDTDQHLGKEFYGDFGAFDVSLTVASNLVVGATGTLLNENEVLPDSLRKMLDIRNFAGKAWESMPSVITPYDSTQRKTWRFFAQNVHDFAWTADPTYRIGEVLLKLYDPLLKATRTVSCQSMAQESHAGRWQDAANFTAAAIAVYSRDFGTYSWNKIIVADARDGMEYPMLTLDGGQTPAYFNLIAHEVGHMWYFGQVGSNETYRAALDEGFTQFIESWAMKKIIGDTMPGPYYGNKYYAHFKEPVMVTDVRIYTPYLTDAAQGTDESINQHSDAFNGALGQGGGYRHVYFKTATMLWNLQYVLGDSLFNEAMKHYFNQWKMCHPYFEDFRNSMIQFTHADLNWFFDEWIETTKTIDYSVTGVQRKSGDEFEIEFKRKGRSQMPIDFEVESKNGSKYEFYIPNTWYQKKTSASILPKWYGWDKLHATYKCSVTIPSGIKQVSIDPSNRLADVYMPDNKWRAEIEWHFDSQVYNTPDWKKYEVNWRPDLWYNAVDGIKIGFHFDGDYFNLKNKFSLTAWLNTTLLQDGIFNYLLEHAGYDSIFPVSFNFSYSSNTHHFIKRSSVNFSLKYLDGLLGGSTAFTVQANARNSFTGGVKTMYRPAIFDLNYLLYPDLWDAKKMNTISMINYRHTYQYFKGTGDINIGLRSSSLFSDYSYADITLTSINRNKLGRLNLGTRVFSRVGSGNPAPESALYLSGASPEELMENKFTRSKAFIPQEWVGYENKILHFHQGGGLNLRGYAGYINPELDEEDSLFYYVYSGNSGASINAELDFDDLLKVHPKLFREWLHIDTYIFADAGAMGYRNSNHSFFISGIRADAGLGIASTIKSWGPLEKVLPLILRIDFPFFINQPPSTEPHYFDLRWVLGIGRSF